MIRILSIALAAALMACAAPTPPHGEVTDLTPILPGPPSKIPSLTLALAWDGTQVPLPGPIDADRLVFNTPQYRNWQYRGTGNNFTLLDPTGACYEVQTVGKSDTFRTVKTVRQPPAPQNALSPKKKKEKKKKVKDELVSIHGVKVIVTLYRPDATLDNVTSYRSDGTLDHWIVYSPDGQTRLMRVQMRAASECPPGTGLIHSVYYYEPERIRQLLVNARNVAWREAVVTESGAVRTRLHEDAKQADALRKLGSATK